MALIIGTFGSGYQNPYQDTYNATQEVFEEACQKHGLEHAIRTLVERITIMPEGEQETETEKCGRLLAKTCGPGEFRKVIEVIAEIGTRVSKKDRSTYKKLKKVCINLMAETSHASSEGL